MPVQHRTQGIVPATQNEYDLRRVGLVSFHVGRQSLSPECMEQGRSSRGCPYSRWGEAWKSDGVVVLRPIRFANFDFSQRGQ